MTEEDSIYSKQRLDPELVELIRKDLQREYDKKFLETVTGPDIYGPGNFEVYLDRNEEWQIRPIEGWRPAVLRGIFVEESDG